MKHRRLLRSHASKSPYRTFQVGAFGDNVCDDGVAEWSKALALQAREVIPILHLWWPSCHELWKALYQRCQRCEHRSVTTGVGGSLTVQTLIESRTPMQLQLRRPLARAISSRSGAPIRAAGFT